LIGDDIEQDIGGSLRAGLGGAILVRTGKYVENDECRDIDLPANARQK